MPLTYGLIMTPEIMLIIGLLIANMWLTWKLSGELAQRVVTVAKELDQNIGTAIQTILENGFGSGEQPNLVQSLAVEFFRNMKNNSDNRPRGQDGKFIEAQVIEQ